MEMEYDYKPKSLNSKGGGGYDIYEAGKEDIVGAKLHGGNFPMAGPGTEQFDSGSGGSLANGLYMKESFLDVMPEEIGLGTAGPNQLPIGPSREGASRGTRFG